jgi:transglutaminase-like putative cysteine protease
VLGACAILLGSVLGFAQAPVVHEFIEPNAEEDIDVGATTPDGRMPAAVRTPSGVISAPSFGSTGPRQVAYGGSATPDSIDATYRIDRDTTQPDSVHYDDPFTPLVAPFKRLYAFDAVDESLELGVADKSLEPVLIGGELRASEDHFFGDLFVDIAQGVPVRVPTVGPGTRVLAMRVEPSSKLEVVRDGAENFFVIGQERRRVRLILELAAPRAGFSSEFPAVSYASLASSVSSLPASARPVVNEVLARLGLSQAVPPREAVAALVAHFRSFAPSSDPPDATSGPGLFRELVLGKKGVCRHRAYGFVLTALGLGIPARFVRNEAHAWVEVGDGRLWRRIDLGGAAGRFEVDTRSGAPPHAVPPDPYAWPEGAESGLVRANSGAAPTTGQSQSPGGTSSPSNPGTTGFSSAAVPSSQAGGAGRTPPDFAAPIDPASDHPRSLVELDLNVGEARRGTPLHVTGQVTSDGAPCPNARVDVTLTGDSGEILIGSVPTDADGRYDSRVTVPFDIEVGDYTLRAWTPGAGDCGASE